MCCVKIYNCRKAAHREYKAFLVCQSNVIFTKAGEGFRFTITSICRLQLLRKKKVKCLNWITRVQNVQKSCVAFVYNGDKTLLYIYIINTVSTNQCFYYFTHFMLWSFSITTQCLTSGTSTYMTQVVRRLHRDVKLT